MPFNEQVKRRRVQIKISPGRSEDLVPCLTNGILIIDEVIRKLKGRQNFIPVISMEGYKDGTDGRGGKVCTNGCNMLLRNWAISTSSGVFT